MFKIYLKQSSEILQRYPSSKFPSFHKPSLSHKSYSCSTLNFHVTLQKKRLRALRMSTFPNQRESAGNRHVTFRNWCLGVIVISCSTARKHSFFETTFFLRRQKKVSVHQHGGGQGGPMRDNRTETQADSVENYIPAKKRNSGPVIRSVNRTCSSRPLLENKSSSQFASSSSYCVRVSDSETKNELFKIKTLDLRGGATTTQDGKGTAAQRGKG